MAMQFKLDNELELVFAVVFQKVIQLPYVESFLNEMQLTFKSKFGDQLMTPQRFGGNYDFDREFRATLASAESSAKQSSKAPKAMRSFNESLKSKKTVASLIESPQDIKNKDQTKRVNIVESPKSVSVDRGASNEDIILENRKKLREKLAGKKSPPENRSKGENREKAGKKPRVWDLGGNTKDAVVLDRSKDNPEDVGYKNIQTNVCHLPIYTLYKRVTVN